MGRQIACLLVALFVVVAAFVGMARAFSPSFDQCIGKAKADKQQTTDKEGSARLAETIGSYVGCSGEYVEANKNVITALALIAIAAFTCTLWLATSRQALLTREALVADKKAFVFPIGLYQSYEKDTATSFYNWRFKPNWRNSGDTPTRNLRLHVVCELRDTLLPANFDFDLPNRNPQTGLLGPKFDSPFGVAPTPPYPAITAQDVADVQQARKTLYLIGWVKYFDVFPGTPEHITRFCWQIMPEGDPYTFVPNDPNNALLFGYVHNFRGNSADNE
jgi:hypothetical protein